MASNSERKKGETPLRNLQGNPDEVYNELFQQYHAQLTLFALRMTKDQAAAEDIAEDAFITLWQKRETLPEISSPKSYLYTIARNGSLNWIRKTRREEIRNKTAANLEDEFAGSALDAMIFSETMGKIYAAIDQLPAQCKKVLTMHFVEGKKLPEIAEIMNLSVNTVKTHRARGISLLQKALSNLMRCVLSVLAAICFNL